MAIVPSSVSVAPNTSGVAVLVTSVGPGTTVIHSTSLTGFADTTAKVTVVGDGSINLSAGLSVSPGQTALAPGTTVIHAGAPHIPDATLIVTVR